MKHCMNAKCATKIIYLWRARSKSRKLSIDLVKIHDFPRQITLICDRNSKLKLLNFH